VTLVNSKYISAFLDIILVSHSYKSHGPQRAMKNQQDLIFERYH